MARTGWLPRVEAAIVVYLYAEIECRIDKNLMITGRVCLAKENKDPRVMLEYWAAVFATPT